MNIKTYEILAQWIGKQHKVTIEFKPGIPGPMADTKNNVIMLPDTIKTENPYAALSSLMHEAAHLNHTKKVPTETIVKTNLEFNILNAIEDVRVDRHNFYLLPNIHDFYEKSMIDIKAKNDKQDVKKIPLGNKVLFNGICELTDFNKYKLKDKETIDFNRKHGVSSLMDDGVDLLERGKYKETAEIIQKIMKIFEWDKLPQSPAPKSMLGSGSGGGGGKGDKNETGTKEGDVGGLMDKGDPFGTSREPGKGTTTVNQTLLGSIGLTEQTVSRFKDLLSTKEIKRIEEGNQLNTDNITSFFTGDLEELFEEEKVYRKYKSKIMLLMDSSGSMGAQLFCGKSRKEATASVVEEVVKILKEVKSLAGVDIDYALSCFDGYYHSLSKENWRTEYGRFSGGTDLLEGFKKAQAQMLKDTEIDGKRMIIIFSDGDVYDQDKQEMEKLILQHNADVRVMIIGVGARIDSEMFGDFNIISSVLADVILLEAITTMLE